MQPTSILFFKFILLFKYSIVSDLLSKYIDFPETLSVQGQERKSLFFLIPDSTKAIDVKSLFGKLYSLPYFSVRILQLFIWNSLFPKKSNYR